MIMKTTDTRQGSFAVALETDVIGRGSNDAKQVSQSARLVWLSRGRGAVAGVLIGKPCRGAVALAKAKDTARLALWQRQRELKQARQRLKITSYALARIRARLVWQAGRAGQYDARLGKGAGLGRGYRYGYYTGGAVQNGLSARHGHNHNQ